jgi:hypothetical protein
MAAFDQFGCRFAAEQTRAADHKDFHKGIPPVPLVASIIAVLRGAVNKKVKISQTVLKRFLRNLLQLF